MNLIIRKRREGERGLRKDFLYEAVFIPEGEEAPDRPAADLPEHALYYDNFGDGPAGSCLEAEAGGRAFGAVWSGIMEDSGHADQTPSPAISLCRDCLGRGIGREMMRRKPEQLRDRGWKRASPAVQKAGPAVRMYEAACFRTAFDSAGEYIMVREL